MPYIVSPTGTWLWQYSLLPIGRYTTLASAISYFNSGWLGSETLGEVSSWVYNYASTYGSVADAMSTMTSVYLYPPDIDAGDLHQVAPYVIRSDGPYLAGVGATFDSGVVQIYKYDITIAAVTEYGSGPDYVRQQEYAYSVYIGYSPVNAGAPGEGPPEEPEIPPIPEPVDVTIQLARTTTGYWYPKTGQEAVLEKYRNGVGMIRARYNSDTQIAVIRENNVGGIMIYEESGGVPYGNVYVYRQDRSLLDVVTAAEIGQYLD